MDPRRRASRPGAFSFAALVFSWSLIAWFDPQISGSQLYEAHAWNPRLGSTFALAIDGFSFPLVLLATLLNARRRARLGVDPHRRQALFPAAAAAGDRRCWACSWHATGRCSTSSGN
ncbi:MAG: hypothetical protein MZV65_17870 [Chromatiales bacterium]|nr:hypothetical protein [Chromatiales bacterium]